MIKRPFEKWTITDKRAMSPDGRYAFWIANGFLAFSDDGYYEQLLSVVSIFHRYRMWRELKKEMISRIDETLL